MTSAITKLMLTTLGEDLDEFLNNLYNTERKIYISKRVGMTAAFRGSIYRKMEDDAWKEFNNKFPFGEWRVKILDRPDVIESIRTIKTSKLNQIINAINNLFKCLDILSNGLDTVIEKTGLHTMVLGNSPVIVDTEEMGAITSSSDIEDYYKGLLSASTAGELGADHAVKPKVKDKNTKTKKVNSVKIIKKARSKK